MSFLSDVTDSLSGGLAGHFLGRESERRSQKRSFRHSKELQERAQVFSAAEAKRQMDFQERMSSTQVQRATEDLDKAGLNRILALGQPAAAPPGAMGAAGTPSGSGGSGGGAASSGAAAGVQAATARHMIENLKANTEKTTQEGRAAGAAADRTEFFNIPISMIMDELGRSGDAARFLNSKIKEGVNWLQKNKSGKPTTIHIRRGRYDK